MLHGLVRRGGVIAGAAVLVCVGFASNPESASAEVRAGIPNLFRCTTSTQCVQVNGPHARGVKDLCYLRIAGTANVRVVACPTRTSRARP